MPPTCHAADGLAPFSRWSLPLFRHQPQWPRVRRPTIATITDGPSERMEQIRSTFEQEIAALARGGFDILFRKQGAGGDWTVPGVEAPCRRCWRTLSRHGC
jgi:hypothetical protein